MKYFLIFCLGILGMKAHSQVLQLRPETRMDSILVLDSMIHRAGDKSLSFSLAAYNHQIYLGGGLRYRVFLGSGFSLDTDVVVSKDYFHFGPGIIGLPLWSLSNGMEFDSFEEFALVVIAGILSFEHFAIHIPKSRNNDISPYISLARIHSTYYLPDAPTQDVDVSIVLGCEWSKYKFRKNWSTFFEVSKPYSSNHFRFSAGFTFGWIFFNK